MQRMKQSVERTMPHIIALIPKWSGNLGNLTPLGFDLLVASARAQEESRTRMFQEERTSGSGLRAQEGQMSSFWLSVGMWIWNVFF